MRSTTRSSSAEGVPPCRATQLRTASAAPLRICLPPTSRPDIRVWAVNGMKACVLGELALR